MKEDKIKRDVLFIYATKENKLYVEKLAKLHGEKLSTVVNKLIDGYRNGKKAKFSDGKIPGFVKKARDWEEKKRAKLEETIVNNIQELIE